MYDTLRFRLAHNRRWRPLIGGLDAQRIRTLTHSYMRTPNYRTWDA